MKITVVGCGNAFSKKNYNQSFLLEACENDCDENGACKSCENSRKMIIELP